MCTNVISFPFVTDGHFAEYLQESLLFYTHTKYVYKIKCTCDIYTDSLSCTSIPKGIDTIVSIKELICV